MTKAEVLAKWSQCCDAREISGRVVRDGCWRPLAHALRHKDCDEAKVTVVEQDGSTILKIEPKAVKPPEGKSAIVRPAFLLVVL